MKKIKASTTDPDSGYMFRDNKPKGFFYLDHICRGIVDKKITPVIAYRLGPHVKGKYTKNKFTYVKEWDAYACELAFLMFKNKRRCRT